MEWIGLLLKATRHGGTVKVTPSEGSSARRRRKTTKGPQDNEGGTRDRKYYVFFEVWFCCAICEGGCLCN